MSDAQRWRASAPDRLADDLAHWLATTDGTVGTVSTVRVAVDGPPCSAPDVLADALVEPLRALGRPAVHVRASSFWHDASLRLEYGREDVDGYPSWLDAGALQREVLTPVVDARQYLPSLRDPHTNRSTRATPRPAPVGTVLVVSGALLLGLGLTFDRTVHLQMSPAARARRTPDQDAWTLPAFVRYDADVVPSDVADKVIRMDDPRHPAVRA